MSANLPGRLTQAEVDRLTRDFLERLQEVEEWARDIFVNTSSDVVRFELGLILMREATRRMPPTLPVSEDKLEP